MAGAGAAQIPAPVRGDRARVTALPDPHVLEPGPPGGGKAEWLPGLRGDNPRFVVTNLPPDQVGAQPLYERVYCGQGDMENRIKEQQLWLFADRTSTATMRTN